jgi:alanine racemase
MTRPTRFLIHLDRLVRNCAKARQLHGGRILAVIKANAYGHGGLACAQALQSTADGFAVATLDEALRLRQGGITGPILLLEGVFAAAEMVDVAAHQLTPVIHHATQVKGLSTLKPNQKVDVWLKIDTGMHRLGVAPDECQATFAALRASAHVSSVTLMTHFANADGADAESLITPMQRFNQATRGLDAPTSLCNSGAILGHTEVRGDWARPGLMLYGIDPGAPDLAPRGRLERVMTLESAISAIRTIAVNESVGYGGVFRAQRTTRVGVIPCGYADGYPRNAAQSTPIGVAGHKAPLIGRVSMDMLMVDLTDLPQVGLGAAVELWGDQIPVEQVAQGAGTVAYELLCNAKRAPRI